MNMRLPCAACVLALVLSLPSAATASPIELDFAGHVTHVGDPFGLVGSQIAVDDPVVASVRYDTGTPDLYPADPTRGTYLSAGWLKIQIGSLAFEQTGGVLIDVLHHGNGNQELFQALVCCGADGDFGAPTAWPPSLPQFPYYTLGFGIGQTHLPYTLLSSDALPAELDLALADFANGEVVAATRDETKYDVHFQLDSKQPVPAPEPAELSLLCAGVTWFCARYSRRFVRAHTLHARSAGGPPCRS